MSQRAFLQALEADLHAAFADDDMADSGTITRSSGTAIACSVYVDRSTQSLSLAGIQARASAALITVLRAGVTIVPQRDDLIEVDSDAWKVESIIDSDESHWVLLCRA